MILVFLLLGLIPLHQFISYRQTEKNLISKVDGFRLPKVFLRDDRANNLLGKFYQRRFLHTGSRTDYFKAALAYLHAIQLNPIKASYYFNLAELLRRDSWRAASYQYRKWALLKANQLDPNNVLYLLALSRFAYYSDDLLSALSYLRKANEISPEILFSFLISKENRLADFHPMTIIFLKENIAKEPLNWRWYYLLGQSYRFNLMPKAAVKVLEEGYAKTEVMHLLGLLKHMKTLIIYNLPGP